MDDQYFLSVKVRELRHESDPSPYKTAFTSDVHRHSNRVGLLQRKDTDLRQAREETRVTESGEVSLWSFHGPFSVKS